MEQDVNKVKSQINTFARFVKLVKNSKCVEKREELHKLRMNKSMHSFFKMMWRKCIRMLKWNKCKCPEMEQEWITVLTTHKTHFYHNHLATNLQKVRFHLLKD